MGLTGGLKPGAEGVRRETESLVDSSLNEDILHLYFGMIKKYNGLQNNEYLHH